jgi:MFS family permease
MFLLNMVKYLWPVHLETEWGSQQFAWQWIALVLLPLTLNVISARYLAWKSKQWVGEDGRHVNLLQSIYIVAGFWAATLIIILSVATFMGQNSFLLFFVSIAMMEFTFGIIAPVFETLINYYIPPKDSQERATILSAGSMIRGILMCLLAILIL